MPGIANAEVLERRYFIFLGPDKVGSTWLYRQLQQHPEVVVSPAKDLYFYDRYFDRGLAWYESQFKRGPGVRADISHDYLFSDAAAERIKRTLADRRLLAVLRSPLQRSFSQFLYLYRAGKVPLDFDAAVDLCPQILENSMYARHLSRYLERFDATELKVLLYDDLLTDATGFLVKILRHAGVTADHKYLGRAEERHLEASEPRSRILASLAKDAASVVRGVGLPKLVGRVKRSAAAGLLYRPFSDRPVMSPEQVERYAPTFMPEVERLEKLLGLDLSGWRDDLEPA